MLSLLFYCFVFIRKKNLSLVSYIIYLFCFSHFYLLYFSGFARLMSCHGNCETHLGALCGSTWYLCLVRHLLVLWLVNLVSCSEAVRTTGATVLLSNACGLTKYLASLHLVSSSSETHAITSAKPLLRPYAEAMLAVQWQSWLGPQLWREFDQLNVVRY